MKQMYVGRKSKPQKSRHIQKEKDQDKDILHIGAYSGKKYLLCLAPGGLAYWIGSGMTVLLYYTNYM